MFLRLKKIFVYVIPVLFLLCATQQIGFACDKHNATASVNKIEKKATCNKKSCCCQHLESKKSGNKHKNCSDKCGDKSCCCSPNFSFSAVQTVPIDIKLKNPTIFLSYKAGWYYDEKIPNSVYLAIWLPPKISC